MSIEKLMLEHCEIDKLFYEEVLEQMRSESEFLISIYSNSILFEAETNNISESNNKNKQWLDRLVEAIQKLFDEFTSKIREASSDQKINNIKDNITILNSLDYKELSTSLPPYWNTSTKDILTTCNTLLDMMNRTPSPQELEKLSDRNAVEHYGEFGKILIGNLSFAESIKLKFNGRAENTPETVTINSTSSPNFENVIKQYAIPYVLGYSSETYNNLRNTINKYKRNADIIKKELDKRNVTESFCLIENAYYSDLKLDKYVKIYEADESADNSDNTPKKAQIIDNSKNGPMSNTSSLPTNHLKYIKHVISLNQIALAAAMSELENRFNTYVALLNNLSKTERAKQKITTDDKKEQ